MTALPASLLQRGLSRDGRARTSHRRGAILVGVLWVLIFLGFLAVVLRVHVGSVVASVRVTEDKAAARIIAEAGLAKAAALVLAGPQAGETELDDTISGSTETATGSVSVQMTNEAWRIDFNTGERPLIVGALRAAGAAPPLADRLTDQIVSRRPRTEGDPTTVGTAGFQTVSEIALIEGMPVEVAMRLTRYATVSSGLKGVRLEALDEDLLRDIPDLSRDVVAAILRYRSGDISRQQLDQVLAPVTLNVVEKTLAWRVRLDVDLPAGHKEAHEALIMISPDDNAPYRILDWRRVVDEVE